MNPIPSDVLDRQLALDLQELAGRASPPDRVDAILRRLTATPSTARTSPARSRLLVAAFMLFGVGITIAVAMVRQPPAPGEATSVAAAPVANEQGRRHTPPPLPPSVIPTDPQHYAPVATTTSTTVLYSVPCSCTMYNYTGLQVPGTLYMYNVGNLFAVIKL